VTQIAQQVAQIRQAARTLRERAARATAAPWRVVVDDSEDTRTIAQQCVSSAHPLSDPDRVMVYDCCRDGVLHGDPGFNTAADALYAATVDPVVGLMLADLLDIEADHADGIGRRPPLIVRSLARAITNQTKGEAK